MYFREKSDLLKKKVKRCFYRIAIFILGKYQKRNLVFLGNYLLNYRIKNIHSVYACHIPSLQTADMSDGPQKRIPSFCWLSQHRPKSFQESESRLQGGGNRSRSILFFKILMTTWSRVDFCRTSRDRPLWLAASATFFFIFLFFILSRSAL